MNLILSTQQIAGFLTPVIIIFMILLVNDKRIMGKHTNNKLQNIISTVTVVLIMACTVALLVAQFI
jgi:Mn2+/Fe2+ NRAMP family transporter